MKYRTEEQFQEIVNSATNGNWSTAYEECERFAFYANDLIRANEEAKENGGDYFEDLTDIALIVEGAQKIRKEKAIEYAEKVLITKWKKIIKAKNKKILNLKNKK